MASVDPPARKGLPPEAYEVVPGREYRPYVPPNERMAEFTVKAVVVGILMAVVFGAANAYLGLRVGLTVSASIPAAVMAVAIFRAFRRGTILETNMVQTIGSAGESVAAGVIFTLPALFIWQRTDPTIMIDLVQVSVIAAFGGLLGVLFMIPLRRYLISREHGRLPYPEGTACAEVQAPG
ncbi:MAG: OPT/YSL family transporter, partial [Gemmatimonadota bacterium]|nr:OPT/YSL family transporter [Gemmatimonadota bacterium]